MLAYGYSYKEIAKQLKISPRTVEEHFNKLKELLGLSFKQELIKKFHNRPIRWLIHKM